MHISPTVLLSCLIFFFFSHSLPLSVLASWRAYSALAFSTVYSIVYVRCGIFRETEVSAVVYHLITVRADVGLWLMDSCEDVDTEIYNCISKQEAVLWYSALKVHDLRGADHETMHTLVQYHWHFNQYTIIVSLWTFMILFLRIFNKEG